MIPEIERHRMAGEFGFFVKCLARAAGNLMQAIDFAEGSPGGQRVAGVLRNIVAAGGLGGWGAAIAGYAQLAAAFVESLSGVSVFDTLLTAGMIRAPIGQRLAIQTLAVVGSTPTEGAPARVGAMTLSGETVEPRKSVGLVVVSETWLGASGAAGSAALTAALRVAVGTATDAAFLADLAASAPTVSGTSSAAADIAAALDAVNVPGARLHLVVPTLLANKLATATTSGGALIHPAMTPAGGEVCGIPTLVSDQVPAATTAGQNPMLIDAASIVGDGEGLVVDASRSAALQMDNAPASGPTAQTSMFQSNSVAVRARRLFGFQAARDSAAAVITGANW
jgi:hypothetical protein